MRPGLIATPSHTKELESKARTRVEAAEHNPEAFKHSGCGVERKFKAIKSLDGKATSKFDQHGFISMMCDHGFVLCSLMMTQDECFLFSIMLLTLLHEHIRNPRMVVLLYDVMCRAAPYLYAHMGDMFIQYVGKTVCLVLSE